MKYCSNRDCSECHSTFESLTFCSQCGTELTPCIQCLCGHSEFNPKLPPAAQPSYCVKCGAHMTDEFLAQCMSAQLKAMVVEIAANG